MRFGFGVAISETRTVTPEGFLSLSGCRVARIGGREYLPEEVKQVKPVDGRVTVLRSKESLFSPQTLASFEGKPVSLKHPPGVEMFDAYTWKKYIVGVMLHVREGQGEDAGCLVADLLLYDQDAINAVMKGEMTELSLGYNSEITDIGNGVGVESPLVGNHVALVPKGRCGSYCAIKDGVQPTGEKMFFSKKDEDTAGTAPVGGENEAIKALHEQLAALQEQIAALQSKPVADEDPDQKQDEDPDQKQVGDQVQPAEEPKVDEGDDKKCDEGDDQPFVATPESIAQIVMRVLEAREQQAVVDEDIKKDAAVVAPSLSADTPNLALAALQEFAKTTHGSQIIAGFGGMKAIKKDSSAQTVLKAIAVTQRFNAKQSFGEGKKDSDSVTKSSYFDQAKKLWG